ncbi:3D domain-containing protein [Bacillus inaquosorum]|uniref:3D domain-containing protein n=1 Tax=Bacillus inaquosorum TaxID=483913 RepID=UPI002280EE54|nr:3D domain-containing protein [Bacillus inaquosorum]MCY8796299.1 3D domain-containing protein [Bacillus inaquosorum]MEC0771993.1 3D domain-containing protein [Bacillus inaquosorum]MEC0797362.1 3D domain-containing protein [Bacillus inaquosorum]
MLAAIASILPLLMPFSADQGECIKVNEIPPIPSVAREEYLTEHGITPIIKTEVKEKVVYKERVVYVDRDTKETVKTEVKDIPKKEYEAPKQGTKAEPKKESQTVSNQSQNFEFTAYSHEPSEAQSHRYNGKIVTATGKDVTDSIYYQGYRILAVNPSVIPYGSILSVSVNGQSFKGIALDTGGAILSRSNRIDLMVTDTNEAMGFGVQQGNISYVRKGW